MKFSKRTRILAAASFLVFILVGSCGRFVGMEWIGSYILTVTIDETGQRPKWVHCRAFWSRGGAQDTLDTVLKHGRSSVDVSVEKGDQHGPVADPFDGLPIDVRIRTEGFDSMMFGEMDISYEKYLMVIGEMPDGRRTGLVIEFPDYHKTKSVLVTLP